MSMVIIVSYCLLLWSRLRQEPSVRAVGTHDPQVEVHCGSIEHGAGDLRAVGRPRGLERVVFDLVVVGAVRVEDPNRRGFPVPCDEPSIPAPIGVVWGQAVIGDR